MSGYRSVAILLLVLHLGACTRWEPTTLSPRALIDEEQPRAVRITRADGSRVALDHPLIRSDSIAVPPGECERVFTTDGRAECAGVTAVALNDIQTLDVRRSDGLRTLGAIALMPVIFVAWASLAMASDEP